MNSIGKSLHADGGISSQSAADDLHRTCSGSTFFIQLDISAGEILWWTLALPDKFVLWRNDVKCRICNSSLYGLLSEMHLTRSYNCFMLFNVVLIIFFHHKYSLY